MFGFLNSAMAVTQRFITFEIGRENFDQLSIMFSMTLTIHVLIAFVVLVLSETIGIWFLNTQLNIPPARMNAANWVYQFSIFTYIISVLNVPYNAVIIAHERMNVYTYMSILEVFLKLVIVFVLIWFNFDKLKFYAMLVSMVGLVCFVIYVIYCKKKFKECNFHFAWKKVLFRQMGSFANWNLLGVFAGIAYNQGVNFFINIFFGPAENAARGIAFLVQGAVNGFVTNFQLAVNPPITKLYAVGDKQNMYSLVFNSSKYSFYLLLLLSLPVLIETKFILDLWLKIVPEYTVIFTRLILLDLLVCSLSGSLQTMVQATGRIKKYQIVVSGILLLNLPVSYILLRLGFSPQSTFIVSIIVSIIALTGRLIVLKKTDGFPSRSFFYEVLLRSIAVFIIWAIIPFYLSHHFHIPTIQFILVLITSVISVITSVYFLGLTKSERIYWSRKFFKFMSRK